jgi:hypothetical protein
LINYGLLAGFLGKDAIIIKYNSSGSVLWAQNFGGINHDYCTDILTDNSNDIYVTGWSKSNVFTVENVNLADSGFFIIKFDPSGSELWAMNTKSCEVNLNGERNLKFTLDSSGKICIVGQLKDSIEFGNFTIVNQNPDSTGSDVFLAKLSSAVNNETVYDCEHSVNIYPNPTTGKVNISGLPASGQVQIINSTGQTLKKLAFKGQESLNITLPGSGIYFIRIISENEVITRKVVVCR